VKNYVKGIHTVTDNPFDAPVANSISANARVETTFTLDTHLGIVKFNRPVVSYRAVTNTPEPATGLVLRCTIEASSGNANRGYAYTWQDRSGNNTGITNIIHVVHRDDIDRADGTVAWETKCLGIAQDEQRKFWEITTPASYSYPGIQRQWVPDGNISEVSFNLGVNEVPRTTVSFGTELDLSTLSEPERLKILRDRETAAASITKSKVLFKQPIQLNESTGD